MEIHRFEKVWIAASILLIVGFISTVAYGAVGPGVKMVDESGGQVDPGTIKNSNFDQTDNFRQPGVYQQGENQFAIYMVAKQFLFQPGSTEPIRIPAGSTVTLYVTSGDVIHGFQIAGTNVNTMVIPGQVAEITVEFNEAKSYGIVCHEYCGAGHHTMEGKITVVPPSEYEGGA
ncbi:MAG: cytochrome c oxidase subunit II [Halobacteriales archaeon]